MQRRTLLTSAVGAAVAATFSTTAGAVQNRVTGSLPNVIDKNIRIYGNDAYPVPHRRAMEIGAVRARMPHDFVPGRRFLLKKGEIRTPGGAPLESDVVLEENMALKMRDGTTIYTDVFRPNDDGRHPAIVAWSPYGKTVGGQRLDDVPKRSGVPQNAVSGLEKFEGADPAFWTAQGYVVLNPDPRGVGHSEGDISYWGRQLAEDGYDFIEWAAAQSWSNGRVGMAGNSWLTVSQWFIAAENPPHLAAIAPWEGFCDHFEEPGTRGGIPEPGFPEVIIKTFAGPNYIEDQPRMIATHLIKDAYWENMAARLEKIQVPAYVVASYTNPVHTHGSFAGFMRIATKDKWLRVNNTNEWYDLYSPKYRAELLAFFDRYLKGMDNGFEKTPRVRYSVLDSGGTAERVDVPAENWPLPETTLKRLYLAEDGRLTESLSTNASSMQYDSASGSVKFRYVFPENADVVGYMRAKLWMETPESDDMDVEVVVRKVSPTGEALHRPIPEFIAPDAVATGRLRASMRELDAKRTTELEPFYVYKHPKKLRPGERVPLDIAVWPMGEHYRKGEVLELEVRGVKIVPTTFEMGFGRHPIPVPAAGGTYDPLHPPVMEVLGGDVPVPASVSAATVPTPASVNHGAHIVHFGGANDSWLQIPILKI